MPDVSNTQGWLLDGFLTTIAVWGWIVAVLLHGLVWRSIEAPAADPIRESGPID